MFSKGKKKTNGSALSAGQTSEGAGSSRAAAVREGAGAMTRRQPSGVPSIISADLTIEGNLVSHGDLQVDGTVKGDISSRTLTLGESGQVEGAIEAETVRICGEVEGEVKAATVVLTKTAKVRGDVVHDSLAIEAGAFIDGHCRRDASASQAPAKLLDAKATPAAGNGQAGVGQAGSGQAGSGQAGGGQAEAGKPAAGGEGKAAAEPGSSAPAR